MTGVGHVVLTFSLEGCRGWIYLACCLQGPLPPQPSPNPQTTPDLWCRCPTNPKLSAATPYTKFIHNVPMNKENRRSCFEQIEISKYMTSRCHSFVVFFNYSIKKRKQFSSPFYVFYYFFEEEEEEKEKIRNSLVKFESRYVKTIVLLLQLFRLFRYSVDKRASITRFKSLQVRLQILSRGWNEKRYQLRLRILLENKR